MIFRFQSLVFGGVTGNKRYPLFNPQLWLFREFPQGENLLRIPAGKAEKRGFACQGVQDKIILVNWKVVHQKKQIALAILLVTFLGWLSDLLERLSDLQLEIKRSL